MLLTLLVMGHEHCKLSCDMFLQHLVYELWELLGQWCSSFWYYMRIWEHVIMMNLALKWMTSYFTTYEMLFEYSTHGRILSPQIIKMALMHSSWSMYGRPADLMLSTNLTCILVVGTRTCFKDIVCSYVITRWWLFVDEVRDLVAERKPDYRRTYIFKLLDVQIPQLVSEKKNFTTGPNDIFGIFHIISWCIWPKYISN